MHGNDGMRTGCSFRDFPLHRQTDDSRASVVLITAFEAAGKVYCFILDVSTVETGHLAGLDIAVDVDNDLCQGVRPVSPHI